MKLLQVLVLFCLLVVSGRAADDPFTGYPEAELDLRPFFSELPCNDGYLFGYTFSWNPTERQAFWMMSAHMEVIDKRNMNLDRKVYILTLRGPQRSITITADFLKNVLELRHDWNGKDHFLEKTWYGDIRPSIDYLAEGYEGTPKITKGKPSKEFIPEIDPFDPCAAKRQEAKET